MEAEKDTVSFESESGGLESFSRGNLRHRKKKLKLRKELDKQHNRIQHASIEGTARNEEVAEAFAAARKALRRSTSNSSIQLKKRNFRKKYDLELDVQKKFTKADLDVYTVPVIHNHFSLLDQNRLMKQMLNIPIDADIGEIVKKLKTGQQLRDEKAAISRVYSTGIEGLDAILTHKGIATGEIIEFCGHSGIGKSLLITTIILNILSSHRETEEEEEAVYFDARGEYSIDKLLNLVTNDTERLNISKRVKIIQVPRMTELVNYVQRYINPENAEQAREMKNVRFIIIDSITAPFFVTSSTADHNKMLISIVHSTFKQLSRKGFIIITTNLGLNSYKISESDKGENLDENEDGEDESIDNANIGEIKPALENTNWKEILDYRFIVSAPQIPKAKALEAVEAPTRIVTLIEPPTMQSFELKFTDAGFADK